MRSIYADLLSRSSSTPSIAGRGVALQLQDAVSPCHPGKPSVVYNATFEGSLDTARRIALNTTPSTTGSRERRITRSSKRSKAEEDPNGARYI